MRSWAHRRALSGKKALPTRPSCQKLVESLVYIERRAPYWDASTPTPEPSRSRYERSSKLMIATLPSTFPTGVLARVCVSDVLTVRYDGSVDELGAPLSGVLRRPLPYRNPHSTDYRRTAKDYASPPTRQAKLPAINTQQSASPILNHVRSISPMSGAIMQTSYVFSRPCTWRRTASAS